MEETSTRNPGLLTTSGCGAGSRSGWYLTGTPARSFVVIWQQEDNVGFIEDDTMDVTDLQGKKVPSEDTASTLERAGPGSVLLVNDR